MDNTPTTKFLVSNCQKKKSATLLLNRNANMDEHIIALTEPWLGTLYNCTFQSPWKVQVKENNSRVALITPPWADSFMHSDQSDRDSIFCTLQIGAESIIVGVMYVENGLIDINIWTQRFRELQAICPKIIVFADSNAHSTLWGYSRSDQKGKRWEELLGLTNLEVFTNSYAVTFQNSRNFSSCIDIAFGTHNMKNQLSDRIMNMFPSASDHLTWGLELGSVREADNDTYWKLQTTDWDKVNHSLLQKIHRVDTSHPFSVIKIDHAVETLTACIKETMEETIHKQLRKPKHKWWNRELSDLQQAVQNENDPVAKSNLTKELELKCLDAQSKNWKDFASSCNSVDGAFLKKKLISLERKEVGLHSIKTDTGAMTQSGKESAQFLLNKWFLMDRGLINNKLDQLQQRINREFPTQDIGSFGQISEADIENAVLSMRPFSAPGIDGIPIIVIQKSLSVILPKLVYIYNGCISLGFTPESWKIGKTVLIPKPGVRKNTHKDYRPITLLSGLTKILEKIILKRLQQVSEISKWVSRKQYAFQAGKSVNQALLQYATRVSTGLKQKVPTMAIHLDIEGAFNAVWMPVLIERLRKLECPNYLINWCYDYLKDRVQLYTSRSFTVETNVGRSTPQGGSLSPFFWNLVINPLIEMLDKKATEVCAFADDIVVIISDISWELVNRRANCILDMISEWSIDNALTFNGEKSVFIQYSWQKRVPRLNLNLGGTQLKRVPKIKYLGVVFTEKLQWKSHILYIANKAMRNLMMLQGIVSRNWGLQGKYTRILYMGAIDPIIMHGCVVWSGALNKAALLKPIKRVQRIAAQMITRCNCKTHYLDLLMLAGLPPIELRAKELSLRSWTSIYADADDPCREAISQIRFHHQVSSHPSAVQQLDLWSREVGVDLNNIEIEHSAMRTRLKSNTPDGLIFTDPDEATIGDLANADITYYTDGSKSPEGVGAAYTKWDRNLMIDSWASSLHPSLSNYKAELIAIRNALENASMEDSRNIAIISDSQAALSALKSPSRDKMTEATRLILKRLNSVKTVRLGWTRAHVGNIGNESADALAKSIAKTRPTNVESKLDRMEIVKNIKVRLNEEWQFMWQSRNGRWSFRWNDKIKKQMRMQSFSNYECEVLNSFISGSIALNAKRYLWRLKNSPFCPFDNGISETPEHFLFHCTNNVNMRNQIGFVSLGETGTRQLTCRTIWKSDSSLRILSECLIERMQSPD